MACRVVFDKWGIPRLFALKMDLGFGCFIVCLAYVYENRRFFKPHLQPFPIYPFVVPCR